MAIQLHQVKTTVNNFDTSVYVRYAQYTHYIESIKNYYHLEQAETIPAQTTIASFDPIDSKMDLLMGAVTQHTPWAMFCLPDHFVKRRRSPFSFSRIAPLLGSEERHEADLIKLDEVICETDEEEEERQVLVRCYELLEKLNDMLNFVVNRVGQFRQG